MAASAAASVLLFFTGTQVLTPPAQPIKQEVAVSSVYPRDPKGNLIPWATLLNRDPEIYELASCESQLNPMARNDGDALITGFPSIGLLQFQPSTFLNGVKQYNAYPGASDKEILAAINDPYLQIFVSRSMINDKQGLQWSCYSIKKLAEKYPLWTTKTSAVSKSLD